MKKKSGAGCGGGAGGCLGAPMRALSRACDSACDLYVRGMSGCARSVPSGSSAAGVVGRGFAGTGAASLRLRVSSESADDLVRDAVRRHQRRVAAGDGAAKTKGVGAGAAARQGRVAPEPAEHAVGQYGAAAGKKGGAGAALVSAAAAPSVWGPARKTKKGGAAAMGTIAEDEACEFAPDGACVSTLKPSRRAGFGAVRAGSGDNVFAR